jgi:hypothetical protein
MPVIKLKNISQKLYLYLRKQPWHWWLAVLITLIAGFLRIYRIPETVMFLGDQGRDAIIVSRIFKELNPVFIGPVTSVGNMYLGPFYYYFMLPFLWISYPSPLGPVYAVAIFSTITVFLMYIFGKKMYSPMVGLLASFLLAFSAEAIDISRFSWNPNLAPLFSLLMIYFSWKAFKNPKNWIVVTFLFSLIIQLHYMTLLTGITAGFLWLYQLIIKLRQNSSSQKKELVFQTIKIIIISCLVFLLTLVPQILFDIRHKGLISSAFKDMFTKEAVFSDKRATGLTENISSLVSYSQTRANHILVRIPFNRIGHYEQLLLFSIITMLIVRFYLQKKNIKPLNKFQQTTFFIVTTFLILGIIGTAVYREPVYNHYIAYLYPVIFLVYALVLDFLLKLNKKIFIFPILAFLGWFLVNNYQRWPLEPNYMYQRTKQVTEQIYRSLDDQEKYEIVLLSGTKDLYGQSYRYFLSTTDKPPIIRDKGETPDTLVIIDEEKKAKDVTALPIYEIVVFPEKSINEFYGNCDKPDVYFLRKHPN